MKITLNNVSVKYDDVIINKLNHEIKGSKIQLVGENGVGKTTLFNVLSNKIKYKGKVDTTDKIVLISQFYVLFEKESIINNLILFDSINVKDEYFNYFENLSDTTLIKNLSGGQKQYLNFLIGINQEADLYLIDEPFNNLDQNLVKKITNFLEDTEKQFIVISHTDKFEFVDKYLVMNEKGLYEK